MRARARARAARGLLLRSRADAPSRARARGARPPRRRCTPPRPALLGRLGERTLVRLGVLLSSAESFFVCALAIGSPSLSWVGALGVVLRVRGRARRVAAEGRTRSARAARALALSTSSRAFWSFFSRSRGAALLGRRRLVGDLLHQHLRVVELPPHVASPRSSSRTPSGGSVSSRTRSHAASTARSAVAARAPRAGAPPCESL